MTTGNTRLKSFLVRLSVFAILHAGTHISLLFKQGMSTSEVYLPSAFSLIFVFWFGPRLTLPLSYLNSVASAYFWGHGFEEWPYWFFYGLTELVYPLVSWLLFVKLSRGKYWLPSLQHTIMFLLVGVFVPAIFEALALQGSLLVTDKLSPGDFWPNAFSNILAEFTTTFILTIPFLYHLTPMLARWKVIVSPARENTQLLGPTPRRVIEMLMIIVGLAILGFNIEFISYWYLYGFISFFVGMRYGFGTVIVTNLFTILIAYVLPYFLLHYTDVATERNLTTFFFTINSMFVFAVLNARVITDLKLTEAELKEQNAKLDRTNRELDKFVYSVSHDLTAPLKSILGLVSIGRLTYDPNELKDYLGRIEKSVHKLEDFISQALDYSRNSRLAVVKEQIDLEELCAELIENIKFNYGTSSIKFQFDLKARLIVQDRVRLKIILNNLLSNAVKYMKSHGDAERFIRIASAEKNGKLFIAVEDNGQGIQADQKNKVFQMFYRGNDQSLGSGLGLYIARETANSLGGELRVESTYGEGSVFTLVLTAG